MGGRNQGRASKYGKQVEGASQCIREADFKGEPGCTGYGNKGRARAMLKYLKTLLRGLFSIVERQVEK
jgi:hypothetical protein